MDVRKDAEQEPVTRHGVQYPRQREHRSDKAANGTAMTLISITVAIDLRIVWFVGLPGEQSENGPGRNDPFHAGPSEMIVNVRERRVRVLRHDIIYEWFHRVNTVGSLGPNTI